LTFLKRLEDKHGDADVILSDCRFPNEINMLREAGGKMVLIDNGHRPEWYDIAYKANQGGLHSECTMLGEYKDVHQSEWRWVGRPVDCTIMNDAPIRNNETLQEFYMAIKVGLNQLR